MEVRELSVPGALEVTPVQHGDDRGVFLEWFREDRFAEATGHRLRLAQANCSVSSAGSLRGVHFAQLPPSQAKWVTCLSGAALDVVVDLRVGSPAYGQWDSVLIDDVDRRAVYLPEGLGHAFLALDDATTIAYLCSTPYAPGREHGVHPLDPDLAIDWPTQDRRGRDITHVLSPKDAAAPSLAEVRDQGLLATYDDCRAFVASLG
ncbi:MAG: dTDP-4-dehydrorhamnose 3,5-epimerase family protein [Marmoricola sp.]|nr:dTDP-4-dehydrorhamnose 3,5-epimerase family protein [Marmoricola sp.]